MSLPYSLRLLCLCCASFFMIHVALSLAIRAATGTALRIAAHLTPRSAARFLFTLRMLPPTLSLVAVFAFCIPSYLWLEPEVASEEVGLLCALTAGLGLAVWTLAIWRAIRAVRGTAHYLHRCQRDGHTINMPGEHSPALLLANKTPVLAMAGILHPQLVISRRVLHELSPEQREAALRHEHAHAVSGDNLKRLLMLLAPDVLPFMRIFGAVERSWAKFTEWAADDQASQGDAQRALSLASALVRVAKMGSRTRISCLSCSLLDDAKDLSERVDRLLRPQRQPEKPVKEVLSALSGTSAVIGAAVAVVLLWPASLSLVHHALEHLIR